MQEEELVVDFVVELDSASIYHGAEGTRDNDPHDALQIT